MKWDKVVVAQTVVGPRRPGGRASSSTNCTWLARAARIVGLFLISLAAGCQQPEIGLASLPDPTFAPQITVYELANRLGLEVRQANARYVQLANQTNVLVLPMGANSWVYVNGRPVARSGGVSVFGGTAWVPASLAEILPAYLVPLPKRVFPPEINRPRAGTGRWLEGSHIVIDPGHGGKDPGAISVYGLSEKTINLAVARSLESLLRNSGARVTLTRSQDSFIDLDERAAVANRVGADLFVSLHADSSRNRRAQGCTVYVCRDADDSTVRAATTVARAMARAGLVTRGIRRADYRVLTRTQCPAILVEMGYLSNAAEARALADRAMQTRLAESLAEGLIGFLHAGGL